MSRPVLLIAGGSRGIGAACARLAGQRGYDVAIVYRSNAAAAAKVVDAVKAGGGKAVAIAGDVTGEAEIVRCFDEATAALGPVTHFVHCAGIVGDASRLEDVTAETVREVIELNTIGGLLCLRECVRRMSTKKGGKGGAVVMLSSMAATIGGGGECVWYAAAKAGVDAMIVGASREVAKEGMRVNAVSPGVIDTDIQPPGRIERVTPVLPMGRAGQADEVAEAILFLLSDAASYVNGANLRVSGAR